MFDRLIFDELIQNIAFLTAYDRGSGRISYPGGPHVVFEFDTTALAGIYRDDNLSFMTKIIFSLPTVYVKGVV